MRRIPLIGIVAAAFLAGAAAFWLIERSRSAATTPYAGTDAPGASDRRVLYWYDPMVPQQRFDKPGKSPYMDMQLVPKYADDGDAAGSVAIEPRLVQKLGVRTARAIRGRLSRNVRATGAVALDEREVAIVSAPVAAIVERLHVRAPLDPVGAGDALFTLLAPEWTAAQEEYLGLRRARSPGLDPLRAAARQRLILLGMSEGQIRALERSGASSPRIVVSAPRSGIVGELTVREGAAVMPGSLLVRINALDTVWINAAVPEREAGAILAGATATASVPALPGRRFDGRVEALLPSVDPTTRTLTARVVVDNAERLLAPGMFAQVELVPSEDGRERVLVPTEAIIATGTRDVVIVAEGKGRFRAQQVRAGAELGGQTEILEGIVAGEPVVLSGQFLIDSEASLTGALARLADGQADAATRDPQPEAQDTNDPQVPPTDADQPLRHSAEGTIERIEGRELTIATGAIPSLRMGAMTMTFVAPAVEPLPALKAGDHVSFAFFTNAGDEFEIASIAVVGDDAKVRGDQP